jgi:RHS repeat-associated protein
MEDPLAFDDITLEFDSTASPILKRRWMHSDAVDEPVGFEAYTASSGVGSGTEHTMFADRQGSVIWVTEPATGQVVAGYEYDGYGQITQTQGTLSQPYGYTGREYDAESGLYHYRARAYDPAAGVFVQVDPIEFDSGTLNLTGYVEANSFNLRDPSGESAQTEYDDINGPGEASGIMFVTHLGMAATNRLVSAFETFSIGYPSRGHVNGRGERSRTKCSPEQILAFAVATDLAKKQIRGKCQGPQKGRKKKLPPAESLDLKRKNLLRMKAWSTLVMARHAENALCFGGGSGNHPEKESEAYDQLLECYKILAFRDPK